MARNKKNNIVTLTTNDIIKVANAMNNLTDDDVFDIIASRTTLRVAEVRFNYLLEGNNREYSVEPNFDKIKETLRQRFDGDTAIRINVYNGSEPLMSFDYANIKIAFINHNEMYLEDITSSKNRYGICYQTPEGYYVEVLGRDIYAIDKKK